MNITDQQFISYIKELTRNKRGTRNVKDSIKSKGFVKIGGGYYKSVYKHSDYSNYVVKIFNFKRGWYGDHSSVGFIPDELKPFWFNNIYVCRRYIIQYFANGIGGSAEEADEWFKRHFNGNAYKHYDIYTNNTRYHDGKPILLDFTCNILKGKLPIRRSPTLKSVL